MQKLPTADYNILVGAWEAIGMPSGAPFLPVVSLAQKHQQDRPRCRGDFHGIRLAVCRLATAGAWCRKLRWHDGMVPDCFTDMVRWSVHLAMSYCLYRGFGVDTHLRGSADALLHEEGAAPPGEVG